jgi:hypothetical protein
MPADPHNWLESPLYEERTPKAPNDRHKSTHTGKPTVGGPDFDAEVVAIGINRFNPQAFIHTRILELAVRKTYLTFSVGLHKTTLYETPVQAGRSCSIFQ